MSIKEAKVTFGSCHCRFSTNVLLIYPSYEDVLLCSTLTSLLSSVSRVLLLKGRHPLNTPDLAGIWSTRQSVTGHLCPSLRSPSRLRPLTYWGAHSRLYSYHYCLVNFCSTEQNVLFAPVDQCKWQVPYTCMPFLIIGLLVAGVAGCQLNRKLAMSLSSSCINSHSVGNFSQPLLLPNSCKCWIPGTIPSLFCSSSSQAVLVRQCICKEPLVRMKVFNSYL